MYRHTPLVNLPMGKKTDGQSPQPPEEPRDRFDLRLDADLRARLKKQAKRKGLSMSAYARLAITTTLEADEATDPNLK